MLERNLMYEFPFPVDIVGHDGILLAVFTTSREYQSWLRVFDFTAEAIALGTLANTGLTYLYWGVNDTLQLAAVANSRHF